MKKRVQISTPVMLVRDTSDLIKALLQDFNNLGRKKISISEARAKARIAEVVVEVKRVEIVATRLGLADVPALPLLGKVLEHDKAGG